jgi:hypothetical protein
MATQRREMTGYDGVYTFYKSGVENVEQAVDRQGHVRYRTVRGSSVGWGDTPEEALAAGPGSVGPAPVSGSPREEAFKLLAQGYPYSNHETGEVLHGEEAVRRFMADTMPLNDDSLLGKLFKKLGL